MAKFYPTLSYDGMIYETPDANRRWRRRILIFLLVCALLDAFIMFFDTDPPGSIDWFLGAGFFWILLIIVGTFIPFVRRRINMLSSYALVCAAFAKDNNFDYVGDQSPSYGLFPPALEGLGLFGREEQVIEGDYGGYLFKTYVYTYRHPSAFRFSRVATRVYEITLPKRLPHMFLATRRGTATKRRTNFNRHFDDNQRIDLEGLFHRYFIVYTHRRTATEALSILAPNVMETLIKTNKDFNIETVGDKLFLYSPDYYFEEKDISKGFMVLESLLKHLDHRLKSWRLVLPNDRKYPFLRSRSGRGTVSIGGRYFNASILLVISLTLRGMARIIEASVSRRTKTVEFMCLGLIMGLVIYLLLIRRQKYKTDLIVQ